jgi:hypothetical protein
VSRDSRQVFDTKVEHLTLEDPGNEASSSASRLALTVSHLSWAGLWPVGKHLALAVERVLRGNRADRTCFRPYRTRTQNRSKGLDHSTGAHHRRPLREAGRRNGHGEDVRGGVRRKCRYLRLRCTVSAAAQVVAPSAIASRRPPSSDDFLNGQRSEQRMVRCPAGKGAERRFVAGIRKQKQEVEGAA